MEATARCIARSTPATALIAGLALLVLGGIATRPAAAQISAADDPRPFVVKVHANWCGTCTALEPTWEKIQADYGSRARLVVFDVSDKKSIAQSRATAEILGLGSFFDEYKGSTGTIAVLRSDRVPVAVMKGEMDLTAYDQAISKALAPSAS